MYSPMVMYEIGKQKHHDDLKQATLIRMAREGTAEPVKNGASLRQKVYTWICELSGRKAEECVVPGERIAAT